MTTKKHPHRTMGPAYSVCIECGHGRGYALHTPEPVKK